jgi:hypothetical protein
MYKAMDNLKQARRCEQINHRIMLRKDVEEEKKTKYDELNAITAKGIRKHLDVKDEKEKDFDAKLSRYLKKEVEEEMLGPTLKLQIQKYHKEHDKWRQKAVRKQKEVDQKLFAQKGKGHWHLMKSMQNRTKAKALIALRRTTRGPRGQPKGSITTDPEELDRIIRDAYGKIYDGNVEDQEGLKKAYMDKYEQYF